MKQKRLGTVGSPALARIWAPADGPWILLPRAQRVIAGVITIERQST